MDSREYIPSFYYGITGCSLIGLFSGIYSYSLFQNLYTKIQESFSLGGISLSFKGKLSEKRALKLVTYIHSKTENDLKSKYPNSDEERRNNLNNSELYEKICNECLNLKNMIFKEYIKKVEDKFGYSYEEITKSLDALDPIEMEEKLIKLTLPRIDNEESFTKEMIFNAFEFYGNNCINKMKDIYKMIKDNSSDEEQKIYFNYQLMIQKFRIDDELYLKYGLKENQLKYLLFKYKLHKDPKIANILKEISHLEENFS